MESLVAELCKRWEDTFISTEAKVRKIITACDGKRQKSAEITASIWNSIQQVPFHVDSIHACQDALENSINSCQQEFSAASQLPSSGGLTFGDVEEMAWALISRQSILLHTCLAEHLINKSFAFSDSFYYWNSISQSRRLLFSYGIQIFPMRALQFIGSETVSNYPTTILDMLRNPLSIKLQLSQEVRLKRDISLGHRKEIATLVGLLFEQKPLSFTRSIEKSLGKSGGFKSTKKSISSSLYLLSHCLDILSSSSSISMESMTPAVNGSQEIIAQIDLSTAGTVDYSLAEAQTIMKELLLKCKSAIKELETTADNLSKPPKYIRLWPQYACYGVIAISSVISFIRNKEELIAAVYNVGDTISKFFLNWILEPLANIWKTIRHENSVKLTSGSRGLNADLESLERMVIAYAKEAQSLSESEIRELTSSVREGDLTVVMKDYEDNIKHPIKNVIAGQMLRILFIQIHKAKVDLEIAMVGIDQMLRSQELNFAFLAVAPTLIISGALVNYLSRSALETSKNWDKKLISSCREIEKMLIRECDKDRLSYGVNGMVIIETYYMIKHLFQRSNNRGKSLLIKEGIMDDLSDLTSEILSPDMKYRVIQRILSSLRS